MYVGFYSFYRSVAQKHRMLIESGDIDQTKFTYENLEILRTSLKGLDVETLARYLIARGNSVELAYNQINRALEWRHTNEPIIKNNIIDLVRVGTFYVHGVDKEERPLFIASSRLHSVKERDLQKLAHVLTWWVDQAISRIPINKSKFTLLIDRSGNTGDTDLEFLKYFGKVFQDLFPERIHRIIIYPTGALFYTIWNLAKWFIDPVTRDKVCTPNDYDELLEYIDEENIPVSIVSKYIYRLIIAEFVINRVVNVRINLVLMIMTTW